MENDLAAYVQLRQDNYNRAPYTTAGLQVEGYGIQSAVMKVRTTYTPLLSCTPLPCAPHPPLP